MGVSRQVRRHQERQVERVGTRPTMHPHDRHPEELPGKGRFNGRCNRRACQEIIEDENWWNSSTRAYYCTPCARLINRESMRFDGIDICTHVTSPDDQPAFPYEESRAFRKQREGVVIR